MDHIIIIIINFIAFVPIIKSINIGKFMLALCIFFVMSLLSIINLFEYYLILYFIDIIFVIVLLYYGYHLNRMLIYGNPYQILIINAFIIGSVAILFLFLSSIFIYKPIYWVVFHSIWHILIVLLFNMIVV